MFSPSSGSLNSVTKHSLLSSVFSADRRIDFFWIDAQVSNCLLHYFRRYLFFSRQRIQGRQHNVFGIDLEEVTQGGAILAAPEAVRAERHQAAWHPPRNRLRQDFHVIRSRDEDARRTLEAAGDVRHARSLSGMKHVPALAIVGLAIQPLVAGHAPHIGGDAVFLFQNLLRL